MFGGGEMPKVNVAISGVSIELEAGEITVNELSELAMGMLERANKVESIKTGGSGVGFVNERRETENATRWYPSSTVNPEVKA